MKKVACILKGYPRLSETFIAQEILALERSGVDIVIYSLRYPADKDIHPIHRQIKAKVHYLPEYLYRHPIRVIAAIVYCLFYKNLCKAVKPFWKDLMRDFTFNRIRRMGQALVFAREIDADREWIYAHFLHTPASVARYGATLMDLPWSCSAHAKDIWTSPQWELKEKMDDLVWLVTCTKSNTDYLKGLAENPDKVNLLYHGLDLNRFEAGNQNVSTTDLSENLELSILSVGRAVNKKGYDILLNALSKLPDKLHWRFIHIGGGGLMDTLRSQAIELGIDNRISWLGAKNAVEVLEAYRSADLFVLPSRIDKNGDRDGLPNVLMEAMSQSLPCISTRISGIPEIIDNQNNGLLVDPEDEIALCDAIVTLAADSDFRIRLGEAGQATVIKNFSMSSNIQQLLQKFS